MRQRPRLRRPVREVRFDALARRADRPPQRRVGIGSREARDEALVPAAGPLRGVPPPMDSGGPQGVENERLRAVQELARRRPATACREPRPGLGYSRARGGSRRKGALRLVRRPDRLYLRHEGPHARLGEVLEVGGYEDGALHRQGQHRVPLHRLSLDAQGARRLYPARKRSGERVPEPRRRQDLDLAQLGRLAARVPRGVPREGGRAALRAVRQCSRDEGQRLHVEGFPGPQQQRAGRRAGQFREPCAGADTRKYCGGAGFRPAAS